MNQDIVEVKLDDLNKLTIHLHGATVISWISDGHEVLFVSEKSIFDNKKAIRGGIPVVFPNFGPWDNNRPQHGFARTKRWSVEKIENLDESACVTLSLRDDEETRKLWNHNFKLTYELKLSRKSLAANFNIQNTGQTEFDFTCLLHTYFKLDNVNNARVFDLNGCEYVDKVANGKVVTETNEFVQIIGETDRVYNSTPSVHKLRTGNQNNETIFIKKENFPETVVWNPWSEKARAMADFGDEEYKNMICVEAGYVRDRFVLKPNEATKMSQLLEIQ